ncbi:MAG: hemerythrin domain-containing protein [Actinomycetota bacterium]|nr:hemerythrin domain-containing protein [Actinomycetota bacterium]
MPDDIVDLIKAQHREVERLLDEAEEEGADTIALLQQVSDLLLPHSEAEESFVYPAIERYEAAEADEVKDGTAEHHHIEAVLRELLAEDPDSPGYDGKQAGMVGELRHHIEEEEQDLLPVLSQRASAEERTEMAVRFAAETGWTGGKEQ